MLQIVKMTADHAAAVLAMMQVFYASEAVSTNGSAEIFASDVENCINDSPYLEGYVFLDGQTVAGYAMAAKSFSTEFGMPCIWIEDLYLLPEYQNQGMGSRFLAYMGKAYPKSLLRLEVEAENHRAVHVYKKCGFTPLPYLELKKHPQI